MSLYFDILALQISYNKIRTAVKTVCDPAADHHHNPKGAHLICRM